MSVFRPQYRTLTPAEEQRVRDIKDLAEQLYTLVNGAGREQALARTKLEECVMWAVKGVTG